ncbi:hypothetical protein [Spirosoma areae]
MQTERNTEVLPEVVPPQAESPAEAPQNPSVTIPLQALSGNTSEPVLPVIPQPGITPVNPVIQGNLAGLPQHEPEGITEGTIPKTYKLPMSVIPTMERMIANLNAVLPYGTPPVTMHSYGVELLSKHEELRRSFLEAESLKGQLQIAQTQLREARYELSTLTSELNKANSLNGTPPAPVPPESVVPGVLPEILPPAKDTWYERYQDVAKELKATVDAHQKDKDQLLSLGNVIQVLPQLIEQLCVEAANNSWRTPEYYSTYFEELLAPHLQ